MPGVAKGDPVSDHRSAAQQPRPLYRVLAKSVADRVHRRLQTRVAWFGRSREEIHLPRAGIAEPREPDA